MQNNRMYSQMQKAARLWLQDRQPEDIAHWLTVALDGTVEDEKIKFLIEMSYGLTA